MRFFAQDTGKATKLKRKEVIEVKEYADLFMRDLFVSKDLNRIPKKFFARNFKKHFSEGDAWFQQVPEINKQISLNENFRYQVLMFNFIYLISVYALSKDLTTNALGIRDLLPPSIINLIKADFVLSPLLNLQTEWKIENVQQLRDGMNSFRKVLDTLRKYIKEQDSKWTSRYALLVGQAQKYNDEPWTSDCHIKKCGDLSPNTIIIYADNFPLHLVISKNNGKLKIMDILPFSK